MKKFLSLVIAMLPLVMVAQVKLGVVDSKKVFDLMPDKVQAEALLKVASDKYKAEYRVMEMDFNKKYADYQAVAADPTTPETILERRVQELKESNTKIEAFQENTAAELEAKRAELMSPIEAKIQEAIEDVSLEQSLSIVFDTAKTPVAYTGPETIDITDLVLVRLGLK